MKRFITILLLFTATNTFAQQIDLSGFWPNISDENMDIVWLDHLKAEIPINKNMIFSAGLILPAGYYSLRNAGVKVYLEPGMSLDVSRGNGAIEYSGKGSIENDIIAQKDELAASIFLMTGRYLSDKLNMMEPDDFLAKVKSYTSAAFKLINNPVVSAYFKNSQTECINYFCKRITNDYRARYGIDAIKEKEAGPLLQDYFKLGQTAELWKKYKQAVQAAHIKSLSPADSVRLDPFRDFDMNNELAYRSSEDYRVLYDKKYVALMNKAFAADRSVKGKDLSDKVISENINNSFIRQEVEYQYVLNRFKINREKDQTYQQYIVTATNKEYIEDIKRLYWGTKTKEGLPSPDFQCIGANGKKVSLSDFRGKYVYIDLWATWCVSCIAEMPDLKSLEKKYEGKKIQFVSISIDRKQDELKWKKFVKDSHLIGQQLINYDGKSDFADFFRISTVPRFILIDPNGLIVNEDALRPGEHDLAKQLDSLLAKLN